MRLSMMADNLTKAQRSYCMSQVKGKDTLIERRVRSGLHRKGYRFRKHVASLPGKPDLVFTKFKVAVFIDGDFWHGWRFPLWRHKLSTVWQKKIEKNRARDTTNFRLLRSMGWTVIRVWDHEVKKDVEMVVHRIINALAASKL